MISKYKLLFISIMLVLVSGCISTSSDEGGDTALENGGEGYFGSTGIFYNYAPEKLEAALKSGKPILLDFSTDWCGVCVAMIPTMEELMTEYEGKASIMTANADVEIDLQRRYNVKFIPSYVFIDKDGNVVKVLIGYQEKEAMKAVLDELIQ